MLKQIAIGIDIGGTFIKTAVVNNQGQILFFKKILTEAKKTKPEILKNIITAFEVSNNEAKRKKIKINNIGIGTPGFVLPNGKMSLISNIPALEGINLIKELNKKILAYRPVFRSFLGSRSLDVGSNEGRNGSVGRKLKIHHENDANCFALAEHMFGSAKNYKNSIGIIWGTGIGSGIIINNKLYRGYKGSAGEFGHSIINPNALIKCSHCKRKGDIESFCSAPNIIKYYKYFGGKKKNVDSIYIMKELDPIAKKVTKQCLKYLSMGIAMLINTLNPEIIVLGGGLSNSSHYKELNKLTNKYVSPGIKNTFKIVKHKIGDYAGTVGAAALTF